MWIRRTGITTIGCRLAIAAEHLGLIFDGLIYLGSLTFLTSSVGARMAGWYARVLWR